MAHGKKTTNLRAVMACVILGSIVVWWLVASRLVGVSVPPEGVLDHEPWVGCGAQGEVCSCGQGKVVRYGVEGVWTERKVCDAKRLVCDTAAFGKDPVPMKRKRCECRADVSSEAPCLLSGECTDQLPDCEKRAQQGMCLTDPTLQKTCKVSCKLCQSSETSGSSLSVKTDAVNEQAKVQELAKLQQKTTKEAAVESPLIGGAIMDQVKLMRKEASVDPSALHKRMAAKYPDGKRPNPLESACTHRHDANEKLLGKVAISPKVASPRILCLVYTMSTRVEAMQAVMATYGPECDGLLFMATDTDGEQQMLRVFHKGKEEYMNMWQKSRSIWGYVGAMQDEGTFDFDWFVIGGDDLYVMVPNLRSYVGSSEILKASENGKKPMFLGRRFIDPVGVVFNSGGAGYVLNRASLSVLYSKLDSKECHPDLRHFSEDREVALCLKEAGIQPYDTKDKHGEERFMPFSPDLHYAYRAANYKKDWYKEYTIDLKEGMEAMSTEVVSFHYLKPNAMRRVHALIFHCPPGKSVVSKWQPCAEEGSTCKCDTEVRFGAWLCDSPDKKCEGFHHKTGPLEIECTNALFEGDPAPGKLKQCYCLNPSHT